MKKNCIVAQSGGPTVAINASLAGVIDGTLSSKSYDTIYGSVYGILGILKSNIINLSQMNSDIPDFINTLKVSPAMYLGSCRYKLPTIESDIEPYKCIFNKFEELNIGAFFYIGGNDSMDTVLKLNQYAQSIGSDVKIIGIPKTIDNDLLVTDHTPGYGSAAKYVATSLLEIAHDTFIYSVNSVTIVEIMGRDAGWLTAAAALARNNYNTAPHLIYLPETVFDENQFIDDVKELLTTRNNVIIAVSEGIKNADGNYLSATNAVADTFGHSQLSGTGKYLEYLVQEKINVKVRSVELNVLQRAAAHVASDTDIEESFLLGYNAIDASLKGLTGHMMTIKRISNRPYITEIDTADISNIANQVKSIPREWINDRGNNVTDELVDYIKPLIVGETDVKYIDGLPVYLPVTHLD